MRRKGKLRLQFLPLNIVKEITSFLIVITKLLFSFYTQTLMQSIHRELAAVSEVC